MRVVFFREISGSQKNFTGWRHKHEKKTHENVKITIHAESRRAICAKKMQKLSRHGELERELKLQTTTTRNFATIWQSWKQWNSWKTRISFGLMCTNVISTMPHVTFNWLTARNHSVSRRKCNNIAIDGDKREEKRFHNFTNGYRPSFEIISFLISQNIHFNLAMKIFFQETSTRVDKWAMR